MVLLLRRIIPMKSAVLQWRIYIRIHKLSRWWKVWNIVEIEIIIKFIWGRINVNAVMAGILLVKNLFNIGKKEGQLKKKNWLLSISINNVDLFFCRINPLKSFLDWIYIKNISRQSDTYLPPAVWIESHKDCKWRLIWQD